MANAHKADKDMLTWRGCGRKEILKAVGDSEQ